MEQLKNNILTISKEHKLAHIGSCLSVLPILSDIYSKKTPNDFVILDNAHAHLAHLVVMEHYKLIDSARGMLEKFGIHCDKRAGCDASGGSLGHGLGIAIGYALTTPQIVHCIVSDGSMQEGSNWEALRIANSLELENLKIHANFNGYSAVAEVDTQDLVNRIRTFVPNIAGNVTIYHTSNGEGFEGVAGHYLTI